MTSLGRFHRGKWVGRRLAAVLSAALAAMTIALPVTPPASATTGPHPMTLAQRRAQVASEFPHLGRPATLVAHGGSTTPPHPTGPRHPTTTLPKGVTVGRPDASKPATSLDYGGMAYYLHVYDADGVDVTNTYGHQGAPLILLGGQQITMTARIYNNDAGATDDPVLPVKVLWTVNDCLGHGSTFDFNQTVPAPDWFADDEPSAGVLVSASFTMPTGCQLSITGVNTVLGAEGVGNDPGLTGGTSSVQTVADAPGLTGGPHCPCDGCSCPANITGAPKNHQYRGDPVDTATGEYVDSVTDATEPGKGLDLDVTREYSSAATTAGVLGPGWRLPWETSLDVRSSGDVVLTAPDGSIATYTRNSDGTFTTPFQLTATMAAVSTGYTLTTVDHRVYGYDTSGNLVSSVDRTGLGLRYTWASGQLTGITDAAGRVARLTYSGSLLTGIALGDGRTIGYGYTAGELSSVTGPDGGTSTIGYDSAGRLTSITNPDGNALVRNTYDSSGRVVSQLDAAGSGTTFSYASGETDTTAPDGGIWTDVYDGGLLLASIDPYGDKTTYDYDTSWRQSAMTDPLGGHTIDQFDPNSGQLTSHTDADGNVATWTYDSSNNPVGYTDPRGKTTSYTYNALNELTSVTDPVGDTTTFGYDASGQLTSRVDPRGNASGGSPGSYTWTFGYDGQGDLTEVTDPVGDTATAVFDAAGNQRSSTDPMGRTTTATYDGAGRMTSVTEPDTGVTRFGYDAAGLLISRTNPGGNVTRYGYDPDGRTTSVTDPLSRTRTTSYDPAHDSTVFGNADGATETTVTDERGLPTSVTLSDGTPAERFGYDADGRTTNVTDTTGASGYGYDADGRLTSISGAAGPFAYTYDADGDVLTRALPGGAGIGYGYADDGRLTSATIGGATTTYGYDAAGELTTATLPSGNGYVQSRGYDQAGRLISLTDVRSGTTLTGQHLTLDRDGRPTSVDVIRAGLGGATTAYGYDPNGRLTSAVTTGDLPVTGPITSGILGKCLDDYRGGTANGTVVDLYSCNATTSQTWTVNANGTVQHAGKCLDVVGKGTTNGTKVDLNTCDGTASQVWRIGAGDALTNAASGRCLDDPGSTTTDGTQLQIYTCNSTGAQQWRVLTNGVAPTGPLTSGIAGKCLDDYRGGTANGTVVDLYSCNATTSQIWTVYDNGTVQHLGMCLDVVGKGTTNGTKVDLNACNGGSNQIWLPEPDGALVNPASGKCLDDPGSTTTDGTQLQLYTCNGFKAQVWNLPPNQVPRQLGYGYDTSGDMLSRTANGTTTTYSYDAAAELTEAVTGSTTVSYGYDADGRQTSAGPVTRGYNVLGQLTKLVSGGTTTTFGYDAFGNRATTSIGGTAARTNHWDPVNPLPMLASQTVSGGASTSYGYDPLGQPQSITTPAGTYYDLPGPLGTVTDLTNAAGAEQVRDDYDPYGVTTQTSTAVGAPADPLGYDGQYGDPATGDYDLRARDYDPAIAAFTTPDPAEAESGLAYAYAAGNPVTGMDPSGLFTVTPVPCFSFSAGFFLGGSAQLCPLVLGMDDRTGRITFGGTFTAGAGYQSPGVGGSVGYQVTDARSVNQLGGLFEYLGGQLGVGPNMGVTGFDGPCAQAPGGTVVGADFTAGFDAEPGAEFHSGVSNTWIANYFSIG